MFNGLSVYDPGVFNTIAEDVSDDISMISPYETPLLDALSQPARAAQNVLYEWMEEELGPNTMASSVAAGPAVTELSPHNNGVMTYPYLQKGMIFENEETGEQIQIAAVGVNSITVSRGFGGTVADTISAGDSLFLISDAALEGSDVSTDISVPRRRMNNYCQIFKKDIIVSGTMQSMDHLGGISDEYEHQRAMRLREILRDLEKATIRGRLSGNTIGGAAVANTRSMRGLWQSLSTNVTSTGTLTPPVLDNIIEKAWANGATDTDLIVVDSAWKRIIDGWNDTRIEVLQGSGQDMTYRRRVTLHEGTYGTHEVLLNRWMPKNSLMVISKGRVKVVPLNGRSFQHVPVARTGDSQKGMVLGEYTLEVKNEEGMAKAFG